PGRRETGPGSHHGRARSTPGPSARSPHRPDPRTSGIADNGVSSREPCAWCSPRSAGAPGFDLEVLCSLRGRFAGCRVGRGFLGAYLVLLGLTFDLIELTFLLDLP